MHWGLVLFADCFCYFLHKYLLYNMIVNILRVYTVISETFYCNGHLSINYTKIFFSFINQLVYHMSLFLSIIYLLSIYLSIYIYIYVSIIILSFTYTSISVSIIYMYMYLLFPFVFPEIKFMLLWWFYLTI